MNTEEKQVTQEEQEVQVVQTQRQLRVKSPVVWGAVVAQVLAILVTLGVIDTGLSETLNAVVISVLELLVAFGVLNNPTDKGSF